LNADPEITACIPVSRVNANIVVENNLWANIAEMVVI